jgi:hypothetical protein
MLSAAVAMSGTLWAAGASAQAPSKLDPPRPASVQGQVVKIDHGTGKVTLQGPDGKTYEFQANHETLNGLKVGDKIEAKLRQP